MYWNLYYSTCSIACLITTKDIANPNSVSYNYENVLLCYIIRVK